MLKSPAGTFDDIGLPGGFTIAAQIRKDVLVVTAISLR